MKPGSNSVTYIQNIRHDTVLVIFPAPAGASAMRIAPAISASGAMAAWIQPRSRGLISGAAGCGWDGLGPVAVLPADWGRDALVMEASYTYDAVSYLLVMLFSVHLHVLPCRVLPPRGARKR